ncbi:MAG: hypothetical protein ACKOD9_15145, partial [Rubrivivax sp.]
FDLVAGFVYTQVLAACVRLDLFEHLSRSGPLSVEELARRRAMGRVSQKPAAHRWKRWLATSRSRQAANASRQLMPGSPDGPGEGASPSR